MPGDGRRRRSARRVLVEMPPDLYEELKRQAELEDRPVARIVREAIRRYLEEPRGGRRA